MSEFTEKTNAVFDNFCDGRDAIFGKPLKDVWMACGITSTGLSAIV